MKLKIWDFVWLNNMISKLSLKEFSLKILLRLGVKKGFYH